VAEEVLTAWALHRGTRCRGIHWDKWEERGVEHLAELAGCLGGAAVAAVCEAFCEDYAGWRGGMPDLVVWQRREPPPEEEPLAGASGACITPEEEPLAGASGGTGTFYPYGEARLVEVKSPNDKLSEQQRAWIERLSARGVLVEVCSLHADSPRSLHAEPPPSHCCRCAVWARGCARSTIGCARASRPSCSRRRTRRQRRQRRHLLLLLLLLRCRRRHDRWLSRKRSAMRTHSLRLRRRTSWRLARTMQQLSRRR
jgi:hypothetical protein